MYKKFTFSKNLITYFSKKVPIFLFTSYFKVFNNLFIREPGYQFIFKIIYY